MLYLKKVIFNLFDSTSIVHSISSFFNLDELKLENYFKTRNLRFSDFDMEYNKLINEFHININNFNYENALLKLKHVLTDIDKFATLEKYGLKDLSFMLTSDTSLNYFLNSHNIKFNLINKTLLIDNYEYDIIPYTKNEQYPNIDSNILKSINNIHHKLFFYNGEIEAFSLVKTEFLKGYSTIARYPEIIANLDNILRYLNKKTYLGNTWWNMKNSTNLLEFELPVTNLITEKHFCNYLIERCFYGLTDTSVLYEAISLDTNIPHTSIKIIPLNN